MTTLLLKAAYIQSDVKEIIKTAKEVLDLVTYASELWEENTIGLSESCITFTHGLGAMMVGFVGFITNDGSVSKASNEVMDALDTEAIYTAVTTLETFVMSYLETFIPALETVAIDSVESIKTLAELKVIAKKLGVKSYASFKSVINIQAAIDAKNI